MTLPDFYAEIENNGFVVNEAKSEELIARSMWNGMSDLAMRCFNSPEIDINPSSPKQVYALLFDDWKLPRRQGTGEEELTALLNLTEWS